MRRPFAPGTARVPFHDVFHDVKRNRSQHRATHSVWIGQDEVGDSPPDTPVNHRDHYRAMTKRRGTPDASGSGARIRELEAKLKAAMPRSFRVAELHRQHAISDAELQEAHGQVDQILASLRGMDDDFGDELDQCKLAVRRKKAELDEAVAQSEVANSVVARNTRLNERQPGVVGAEDVAQGEHGLEAARARVLIKKIDVEDAELRCRKLERWRARVHEIIDTYTKVH